MTDEEDIQPCLSPLYVSLSKTSSARSNLRPVCLKSAYQKGASVSWFSPVILSTASQPRKKQQHVDPGLLDVGDTGIIFVLQMWTSVRQTHTSATLPRSVSTQKEGTPVPAPTGTGFWKASV